MCNQGIERCERLKGPRWCKRETRRTKDATLAVEWTGQGKNLTVLPENDALLAALYRVGIAVGYISLSKSMDANASRALENIRNGEIDSTWGGA
jgi:hypothetical protein